MTARKPLTETDKAFYRGRADAFLEIARLYDNSFHDGEWHPWASRVARGVSTTSREAAQDALVRSGKKRRPTRG